MRLNILGGESSSTSGSDQALSPNTVPTPYFDHQFLSPRAEDRSKGNQSSQSERRTRIIQHSDIAESDGLVELPPQYSDSREPLYGPEGQWAKSVGVISRTTSS
jgi:hypothetical protein